MKNRVFATFSSLTLLTAAAAFAQSGTALQADIPFEFQVGNTTLPAGHYDVRAEGPASALSIRCFRCKTGVMILTNSVYARQTRETGKLVFNRYGDKYFLASVWTAGGSPGRQLPTSGAERELARNNSAAAPVRVALDRR